MSINILLTYFPNLTVQQQQQFARLPELYNYWNDQINVISRKDIAALYERHVLHSLGIAKVISFKTGTTIMDVGTGGGFPGIPLAILFPKAEFLLVDSIAKKIKVVNEVATALELKNVRSLAIRAEQVNEKFDFIVSRAVTDFAAFYKWVYPKINTKSNNTLANGILYLKGGDLTEELRSFKRAGLFPLTTFFKEEFFETKKVVYLPVA